MRSFQYVAPRSLTDARAMLGDGARALAGGTDLLTLMKADLVTPETLVAIRTLLPRAIEPGAGTLTVGAGVTLDEVARAPRIRTDYSALAQAAEVAASAQLRNMATLGGNLLQRPRCWYFRHPLVHCWLKGGDTCQAREGENQRHAVFDRSPCIAVHPSDLATALVAFDAHVRLLGRDGERTVALADFFILPTDAHRRETGIHDDEILLDVAMPFHPPETRSAYVKAMDRGAFSFALVGAAAVMRISAEGRVGHARVVLGGVAPVPWRSEAAERALLGHEVSDALFARAAHAALEDAKPFAKNGWKLPLGRALVQRALATARDAAGSGPASDAT